MSGSESEDEPARVDPEAPSGESTTEARSTADWLLLPEESPGVRLELRALAEADALDPEQLGAIAQALKAFERPVEARPIEDGKCRRLRRCAEFNGTCPVLTECGSFNAPPPCPTLTVA